MKTYLLTCVCAAEVPVGAAQAGGRIACQGCGRQLEVPKLRDLGKLPFREQSVVPLRAGWNPGQLLLLLGSLLTIGCGLLLIAVPPPPPRPDVTPLIKRAVYDTSIHDCYSNWKTMLSRTGVGRALMPSEKRMQRMESFQNGIRFVLTSVAALATVAALGGGLSLLMGRGNAAKAVDAPTAGRRT